MNEKDAYARLAQINEELVDYVTEKAFENIKRRTPVKTGKARASWKLDKRNHEITTDIDYMTILEMGSSKQAPNGMVRITALETEQYVKEFAGKVK